MPLYPAKTYLLLLATCMSCAFSSSLHAEEDPPSRNVTIEHDKDETSMFMDVTQGEQVLVAYADGRGGPAYPCRGIHFAKPTDDQSLMLQIKSPRARSNDQWGFTWGVKATTISSAITTTTYSMVGGSIRPPAKNEREIRVSHIQLPAAAEGLELHLFPFIRQGDQMSCMLIAISKDKDLLKKHVKLQENTNFDWEKSFSTPGKFVTPSDTDLTADDDAQPPQSGEVGEE